MYIKLVNLGFGFGSARTAVESRLWSSQGWNFPRCTTTTENGREAASLSPLGMWLPLLTSRAGRKWRGEKEPRKRRDD